MAVERKVLLTLEYEGTEYHGWQFQPGLKTVAGELEAAVERALGCRCGVEGASRTDRGVHARGQAAVFTTSTPVPTAKLPVVLNGALPADIRVVAAREVPLSFQPRFDALGKHYRYLFVHGAYEGVFSRRSAERLRTFPDVAAMDRAAGCLVGEHDFRSFQNAARPAPATTVRTIFAARVRAAEPFVVVDVVGSGFLFNMVRIVAGTLLEVGQGRRDPGDVRRLLDVRDRRAAGATAAARGLHLVKVFFSSAEKEAVLAETDGRVRLDPERYLLL